MEAQVLVKVGTEKYKTEINIGHHQVIADEPKDLNGQDLGPKPTDLFLSSLGSCKAITMRMYADLKGWPLESIEIGLSMQTDKDNKIPETQILVEVKLIGDLDDLQRERILKVGEKCPVQKILKNPITIETNLIQ